MTFSAIQNSKFKIQNLLICLPLGVILLMAAHSQAAPPEMACFPSLISSIRLSDPLSFCDEPAPLDRQEIRERMEKEFLLMLWDRPQIILWIKRSQRYLPLIEDMLKAERMPKELKYISIIESALRPHVGSPKGAIGFWQFMPATARNYGLRVDTEFDERRNVFAATGAAIQYFKYLHTRFGSWTLAAAAFNMGEEGLAAEILAQGTDDYYRLYLPLETQRYVFRILSAKLILTDPKKYGFEIKNNDRYPPLKYDRITLTLTQETPIRMVAEAAKTSFKKIKDLNPEIRGHYLSKGTHTVLIAEGSSKNFHKRFSALMENWQSNKGKRLYVVQQGDNLSSIADRFNVPLPALLIWNRRNPSRTIHPGDRLIVFPDTIGSGRKKE
jgi:membrane-bound lytic murein transglycosylase D